MKRHIGRLLIWGILILVLVLKGPACLAPTSADDLAAGYHEYYAGNLRGAVRIAEQRLRANPRLVEARILLARTQLATGQVPRAYEELHRALQVSPGNIDVLYYMGLVSNIMAQGEYSQLFKLAPDSGRSHQLRGDIYRLQKDLTNALEEYEAAVKASPELVEVWLEIGDLERSQLHFEKAAANYQKVLEIQPSNYDAYYGLGACYQQQEPYKAIEFFSRAVQADPKQAESRVALGDVLLKTNQPVEALKQLQTAIQLDSNLRQAYLLQGRAQRALGQEAQAEQSFRRAQEIVQTELEIRRGEVRRSFHLPVSQEKETVPSLPGESQK